MAKYKGVLLGESLADMSVLSEVEVVDIFTKEETAPSEEQPKTWTWYRIRVSEEKLDLIAEKLSSSLKSRAWYTNLWQEGDYLLIFPNKIFRGKSIADPIWNEALDYGLSIGIPYKQLTPLEEILYTE